MKRSTLLATLLLAAAACAHAQSDAAADCRQDLDALAPYMLTNDAGARDHVAQKGQAAFDAALAAARAQAGQIASDEACVDVLRTYLRTYRKWHLSLRSLLPGAATPARAAPAPPSFRILSDRTAMLVLPSFGDPSGAAIAALLKEHVTDIAARPNLLVDVRGNGGGSDWTYAPVLALADANLRRDVGAEYLATPANAAAHRAACAVFAPESQQCRDATGKAADASERAAPGTFIPQPGEPPFEIVAPKQVAPQPSRIAVLTDGRCGSSCEEFLLAMRQSFKVKLFGQSSAGSVDYSNLRPWTLPSGKRRLMYATSRSLRLPEFPVDLAGIPPDQVLPTPADAAARDAEVREVQRVLESGR
ncbi:S41 family peptidase [Ramlibacter algicola]|uniref:Tail specific protease domain-containing protein n=1 Tax=Ramlibacter algicola TaxID=2795217 RepID=A0A934UPW6_9BURK|nr:S41 family peptidase [Ramlibacter algicola]MBK0391028.1 hypothetical protein [Ramlibacter algicola]